MPERAARPASPLVGPPSSLRAPGCDTGVCGSDVPPLVGRILTGTGLTLDQAAARVLADEPLPPELTDVQRRLAHEHALRL